MEVEGDSTAPGCADASSAKEEERPPKPLGFPTSIVTCELLLHLIAVKLSLRH